MRYIIFHGTMGSPEGNWFPWMKAQLEALGHEVWVPTLPTPEGQNPAKWKEALKQQVPFELDPQTILIGHSMGVGFILHLLDADLPEPISRAVLVSGFNTILGNEMFDSLNKPFLRDDFNWGRIKSNAKDWIVLHGSTDPYVPVSESEKLQSNLEADYHLIPDGGHLNAEFGYTSFPYLLDLLKE